MFYLGNKYNRISFFSPISLSRLTTIPLRAYDNLSTALLDSIVLLNLSAAALLDSIVVLNLIAVLLDCLSSAAVATSPSSSESSATSSSGGRRCPL